MKLTRVVQETKDVEQILDVICNKCGLSCSPTRPRCTEPMEDVKLAYGLAEASVSGGFESRVLADLSTYTFSMCEPCLKVLFDSFAIPVEVWAMGRREWWDGAHHMDAPGGPRCRCGEVSRHESGWCGDCGGEAEHSVVAPWGAP